MYLCTHQLCTYEYPHVSYSIIAGLTYIIYLFSISWVLFNVILIFLNEQESFSTPKKYSNTDARQTRLTYVILKFSAGDLLLLSTVESNHFRTMMNKADPHYQVPSWKHLTSKLLPAKITNVQHDLISRLKKADVCATTYLWSSRQMGSYYGVSGNFIVDWVLEYVMLACTRFFVWLCQWSCVLFHSGWWNTRSMTHSKQPQFWIRDSSCTGATSLKAKF